MKTIVIIFISAILTTSVYALPSVGKSVKTSGQSSRTGSKSMTSNSNYSESEAKNRTITRDFSSAKNKSKVWSKAITNSRGISVTRGGLLSMNINLIPFIFEMLADEYPHAKRISLGRTIWLANVGFTGMGNEYYTNNRLVEHYNGLPLRGANVNAYEPDQYIGYSPKVKVSKELKSAMSELYFLADEIDYISNKLRKDETLNVRNIDQKMEELIPAAYEKAKINAEYGDHNIKGECYFEDRKKWSCQNKEYVLDGTGSTVLVKNMKVLYSKDQIDGKSFTLNLTLGTSLSEGVVYAIDDRRSRDNVMAIKNALSAVKTKGKTKSNSMALSKALNKMLKESADVSVDKSMNTNPIK